MNNRHGQYVVQERQVYLREGIGCHLHDNCFTCSDVYANSCQYNPRLSKSSYVIVDLKQHRKLIYEGEDY